MSRDNSKPSAFAPWTESEASENFTNVRPSLSRAQERQARHYNKTRQQMSFEEGDWVLISTKNLPLRRPTKKLTDKYVGPYQIDQVVGGHKLAYRLRLPSTVKIHNVLPVSSLELYRTRNQEPIEPEDHPFIPESTYDVEKILDHQGPKSRRRYLVKWKRHGDEENSWVSRSDFVDKAFLADYDQSVLKLKSSGRTLQEEGATCHAPKVLDHGRWLVDSNHWLE
ncbi:chromo (CHRromatin organization MOdifier) domain-containing protein [Hirsutella rhossiliensis]|uniref:Chromo (CHRromatin organization MOdifier) domain-containing protein n=1 Tax=Hirsutella rhossiliensis TaxID=111463 RepID=A0A9P8MVA2_9HYPO|nr:chromo (CHRromatin organization MOdifier) domain-containing protein [Hirsutella rhossiliensis]KAH0959832.1 chromo (CHRromatin organization MOdifier) domain-containing protein [Hirsutella rhossiliensis]